MRVETIGACGRMVTIYALCGGVNDQPRYVGKTANWLHRRYQNHLSEARKGKRRPVCLWIRKLLDGGEDPTIKWLESVKSHEDWEERERHWILKFRAEGFDLLNLTDGGEGTHGHVRSPLHSAKIALKTRTGDTRNCRQCGKKFWRKRHQITAGEDKFCSRRCYAASLKGQYRPVSEACKVAGVAAASAARRAQTHCKRGHTLSGENMFRTSSGARGCKQCRKIHKKSHEERRRHGQVA